MSLMDELRTRRNIYKRPTAANMPTRRHSSYTVKRPSTSPVTRTFGSFYKPTRASANILIRTPITRQPIRPSGVTRPSPYGTITPSIIPSIRPLIPSVPAGTAATPGGGLPALPTGGLGAQLGSIGTDLSTFGGEISGRARELLPLAINIVAAVIIVKIVLWLVRGRGR